MSIKELYPIINSFTHEYVVELGAKILSKETNKLAFMFISILLVIALSGSIASYFILSDKKKTIMITIATLSVPILLYLGNGLLSSKVNYYKSSTIMAIEEDPDKEIDGIFYKYVQNQKQEDYNYTFTNEVYEEYDKVLQSTYVKLAEILEIPANDLYQLIINNKEYDINTDLSVEEIDKTIEKFINSKYYKVDRTVDIK